MCPDPPRGRAVGPNYRLSTPRKEGGPYFRNLFFLGRRVRPLSGDLPWGGRETTGFVRNRQPPRAEHGRKRNRGAGAKTERAVSLQDYSKGRDPTQVGHPTSPSRPRASRVATQTNSFIVLDKRRGPHGLHRLVSFGAPAPTDQYSVMSRESVPETPLLKPPGSQGEGGGDRGTLLRSRTQTRHSLSVFPGWVSYKWGQNDHGNTLSPTHTG